ncbi:MAG: carboxypeptidase-like regulatory domain-containing protein [Bacteroidia bacterium]|nr:carboxypeptidase-like regulatory domain-containing protein [Bacteroidia bacterium]
MGIAQTGTIKGSVVDSISKEILIFVDVSLSGTPFKTEADIDGFFILDSIPYGTYVLRVSYVGFKTKEQTIILRKGETPNVKIELNSTPEILGAPKLPYVQPMNYQSKDSVTEFYSEGRKICFYQGNSFNSWLVITDTLTNDTLEYDKQISQNYSLSILYENNKPKYQMHCKAYYNKKARKTRKAERHHNFVHKLPRGLRFGHKTCFFPVFYYDKSAKINSRQILVDNKWKKYSDKNLRPSYALFDTYMIKADGIIKSKF